MHETITIRECYFTCDNPKCTITISTKTKGYYLPKGWLSLSEGNGDKPDRATIIKEVCSIKCLLEMLKDESNYEEVKPNSSHD